jgi:hypothetical protein
MNTKKSGALTLRLAGRDLGDVRVRVRCADLRAAIQSRCPKCRRGLYTSYPRPIRADQRPLSA